MAALVPGPAGDAGLGVMAEHPTHMVVLTPSLGGTGGLEGFTAAVISAVDQAGIEATVLTPSKDGSGMGPRQKLAFTAEVVRRCVELRRHRARLVCLHPGLLPAALVGQRALSTGEPVTTLFYGIDAWAAGWAARYLRAHPSVRAVTISSFTGGALASGGPSRLLHPPVDPDMFRGLTAVPPPSAGSRGGLALLSVFRLEDFAYKGGAELVAAAGALRAEGRAVTLTLAGKDGPSTALESAAATRPDWLRVVRSPSAVQLVECYAGADALVLATRQQRRPYPAGEGFGIVLAEAALAGRPVVAPANDGSADAMVDGVTGLRPADQSADALAAVLRWMAAHPAERERMGANGRQWASRAFHPDAFAAHVASALWGEPAEPEWLSLDVFATPPTAREQR